MKTVHRIGDSLIYAPKVRKRLVPDFRNNYLAICFIGEKSYWHYFSYSMAI